MNSDCADAAPLFPRRSYIEMHARERARALLDPGTFRELLGPFDRLSSPWLARQDIVAQSDDGVVIARGQLNGKPAAVASIESAFQGGAIGEVSGAKIAGTLELALRSCEAGTRVTVVLGFETGGVRLQEANLGLAAIAEIHAGIVALRRHVPVVGVIAGTVGCFGGMSLAAALCSHLIMTREARLGMNGPEVIETEAGIAELDAKNRPLIWSLLGGEQRHSTGLVDGLVEDDADTIAGAVREASGTDTDKFRLRCTETGLFRKRLAGIDPEHPPGPSELRTLWAPQGKLS